MIILNNGYIVIKKQQQRLLYYHLTLRKYILILLFTAESLEALRRMAEGTGTPLLVAAGSTVLALNRL